MCENENLIDLSIENDCDHPHKEADYVMKPSIVSAVTPTTASSVFTASLASPLFTEQRRESFGDNNPFDNAQKMANRADDPFECMEKEACYKARYCMQPTTEVKLANLLSLSDDNILDTDDSPNLNSTKAATSIYHTAIGNDLDSESPPISMSIRSTPDTGGSSVYESGGPVDDAGCASASSSDISNSAKTKKVLEYRKRLLKFSITNSSFNSPVSHRNPMVNCYSDIFTQAAKSGDEHMLAFESPLKLFDHDLMSEEPPPPALMTASQEFDADLEMLKIPILHKLPPPPPIVKESSMPAASLNIEKENNNDGINKICSGNNGIAHLSDLAALRERLRAKRAESNKSSNSSNRNNNAIHDVSHLIDDLKSLIGSIDVVNDQKKQQANMLLETLCTAFAATGQKEETRKSNSPSSDHKTPQPIVRQGTFDIELQESNESPKNERNELPNTNNPSIQSNSPVREIPDLMVQSSATYDGETAEEKYDFKRPSVDSISPITISPPPCPQETETYQPTLLQPDVNDIIEQLSKLLEQHQITQQHHQHFSDGSVSDSINNSTATTTAPTFIVVMNSTQMQNNTVQGRHSHITNCILENSFSGDTSDFSASTSLIQRRRSQSLSIHDKVKIIQFPIQHIVPPTPQKQHQEPLTVPSSTTSLQYQDDTPPQEMLTPPSTADVDGVASGVFKTPRMMMRRNSFSSGTPYTPMTKRLTMTNAVNAAPAATTIIRRPSYGGHDGNATSSSSISLRSSSKMLETHHERVRPQHAVHPMPPHSNFNTFKPDLKKKCKTQQSSTESIMRSSGPLKATIPIKKVAPMLKTSPPTPDSGCGVSASSSAELKAATFNTSMHLLAKSGKIPYTSTPMPSSRNAGAHNIAPSLTNTPIKRPSVGGLNATKPSRYSNIATTSNSKLAAYNAGTTAGLKRRTLNELKASPIKSRYSTSGTSSSSSLLSSAASSSSSSSTVPTRSTNRLSLMAKPQANVGKISNKFNALPSATSGGRISTRLGTRTSISGSFNNNRNKENKQP